MTMINISHHILGERNMLYEIRNWLSKNVGPKSALENYWMVGQGWEIITKVTSISGPHDSSDTSTGWWLDIEDEKLACLFQLKWS